MKKEKASECRKFLGWMLFASCVALASGAMLSVALNDRILPDVTVSGIALGGLTIDDARSRLTRWSDEIRHNPIRLYAAGKSWSVASDRIGLTPDVDRILRDAYSIGRTGPLYSQFFERLIPFSNRRIAPTCRIDEAFARKLIVSIAREVNRPPTDAKLVVKHKNITMQRDRIGCRLNEAKALSLLRSGAALALERMNLPAELAPAKVTAGDLRGIDTRLATFSTFFPNRRGDRAHNIRLASAALDGTLIEPEEVFSYNRIVGPRHPDLGFRTAPIYINGEVENGPGGGVCQVSTTVYNAALLAGLEIVSRSHHSMPVHYVPLGRDATVAYGGTDLKFRNDFSHPIYLSAKVYGNTLTAAVFGFAVDKRNVRVYTSRRRSVPMGYEIIAISDPSSDDGPRTIRRQKPPGTSVVVHRCIGYNGKVIEEIISRDRYQPIAKKPVSNTVRLPPASQIGQPARTDIAIQQ